MTPKESRTKPAAAIIFIDKRSERRARARHAWRCSGMTERAQSKQGSIPRRIADSRSAAESAAGAGYRARQLPSPVVLIPFILALVFTACENEYVQELLYGPSILENISVVADDFQSYKLKPALSDDVFEYEVTVPFSTSSINVSSFALLGGNTYYRVKYFDTNGIWTDYGEKSLSGIIAFPHEINIASVSIRVLRFRMEETFYTLTVKRGTDSPLGGILVQGGPDDQNLDPRSLQMSPGFLPEITEYGVQIAEVIEFVRITGQVNPEKVHIYFKLGDRVPASDTSPSAQNYLDIPFPAATDSITVWIQVRVLDRETGLEEPDDRKAPGDPSNPTPGIWIPGDNWKDYETTISRHKKVSIDSSIWLAHRDNRVFCFEIDGLTADNNYYDSPDPPEKEFIPGTPVAFTLTPPFGYKIQGNVQIIHAKGLPHESIEEKPVSPSNRYVFLMSTEKVTIYVNLAEIPAPVGVNIRFVWEYGKDYGTNPNQVLGTNWAHAANNLQTLMDNYNNTPGDQNNYEIWIARGTYRPDWTKLPTGANRPSWSNATIDGYTTRGNEIYWNYVLSEGVKIFGGFSGREETVADKEYRDIQANETILSGNITDSNGNVINKTYRVMTAAGINSALIDGLTFYSSYNVITYSGTLSINALTIPSGWGGIAYIVNSRPLFKNVTFRYGQSNYASGVAIRGSTSCPVFINCNFNHIQSANYGSALGFYNETISPLPSMVMIGGRLTLNWDAGGVISVNNGRSTLVNLSIENNLEHAIFASATNPVTNNVFVNLTIAGNRGTYNDSHYTVKGAASLYNCVVKDNRAAKVDDVPDYQANVDSASDIFNTIAPEHSSNIGDPDNYVNRGDSNNYPVNAAGAWNTSSAGYTNITDSLGTSPPAGPPGSNWTDTLWLEILEALKKDVNGNPRFKGSSIDLGAEEK